MTYRNQNIDTLVALLRDLNDYNIALEQHWYRIPVNSPPKIVKENRIKYLAFYQTSKFGTDAFIVRWFAKVKKIKIVHRDDLFEKEATNKKSRKIYYKLEFDKLRELPKPIPSLRHRPIIFVETTYKKLLNATEINDLFIESPIEEKMWDAFRKEEINAERQYEVIYGKGKNQRYYLDFAMFCKSRNLAVECDGDTYHSELADVKKDKQRDNVLESKGWNILRYTTDDIIYKLNESLLQVKETINNYGGVEDLTGAYHYINGESKQDRLFSI
jgi:very-short-patch-repair endonuclease